MEGQDRIKWWIPSKSGVHWDTAPPVRPAILKLKVQQFLWKHRYSWLLLGASQICNFGRRIAGARKSRLFDGIPLVPPAELNGSLEGMHYIRSCNACMQELRGEYPWFSSVDIPPAIRAFHRGAEWSYRNWSSESKNKEYRSCAPLGGS